VSPITLLEEKQDSSLGEVDKYHFSVFFIHYKLEFLWA